jgi:drug/metabolite transporter (DMT)-like permease
MMTQRITGNLTLAFTLLTVAAGLTYARRMGWVDIDLPARGTMIASGMLVAIYGNAIPKAIRATSPGARSVQRVAGWAFVLSGLAYAAIWAFAPLPIAPDLSMSVLGAALAGVFGYGLWVRGRPSGPDAG